LWARHLTSVNSEPPISLPPPLSVLLTRSCISLQSERTV
jgi:hypothetical protein